MLRVLSALAVLAATRSLADVPIAGAPCPVGGTLPRLVYLSAVMPGACDDALQLQNIIFQIGQTGHLVVDKACTLNAGLRLPSRFTLQGLGLGSISALTFQNDGIAISMCQEQPRSYVTLADLDLYGPYASALPGTHSTGIALANQGIIAIRNVRVSDFATGLSGVRSYSVLVEGSNISNNRNTNIVVGYDSNGWRIRDTIVSRSGGWGINVLGPGDAEPFQTSSGVVVNSSNDLLLDGLRMESNALGALRTNAYGTRVINSRFELNAAGLVGAPNRGLLVDSSALDTRVLTNVFSADCVRMLGAGTQRAFNQPPALDVVQCPP